MSFDSEKFWKERKAWVIRSRRHDQLIDHWDNKLAFAERQRQHCEYGLMRALERQRLDDEANEKRNAERRAWQEKERAERVVDP